MLLQEIIASLVEPNDQEAASTRLILPLRALLQDWKGASIVMSQMVRLDGHFDACNLSDFIEQYPEQGMTDCMNALSIAE